MGAADRVLDVDQAQLVHEPLPEGRAAFIEKPGPDAEIVADRQVPAAPGADRREERQELDRRLGEAVDGLLLWLGSSCRESSPRATSRFSRAARMFEAIPSSDRVKRSRKCRRLPNMMSRMTRRLQRSPSTSMRQIDRAARASLDVQFPPSSAKTGCIIGSVVRQGNQLPYAIGPGRSRHEQASRRMLRSVTRRVRRRPRPEPRRAAGGRRRGLARLDCPDPDVPADAREDGGTTGVDDDFAARGFAERRRMDPRPQHVRTDPRALARRGVEGMVGRRTRPTTARSSC